MKDLILEFQNTTFESSSYQAQQYKMWHRRLKSEVTKIFKNLGCREIKVSRSNHFDFSGFTTDSKGQIWYFSIGDFRAFKKKFLLRTANSYKDYSGGMNNYPTFSDNESFTNSLRRYLG